MSDGQKTILLSKELYEKAKKVNSLESSINVLMDYDVVFSEEYLPLVLYILDNISKTDDEYAHNRYELEALFDSVIEGLSVGEPFLQAVSTLLEVLLYPIFNYEFDENRYKYADFNINVEFFRNIHNYNAEISKKYDDMQEIMDNLIFIKQIKFNNDTQLLEFHTETQNFGVSQYYNSEYKLTKIIFADNSVLNIDFNK